MSGLPLRELVAGKMLGQAAVLDSIDEMRTAWSTSCADCSTQLGAPALSTGFGISGGQRLRTGMRGLVPSDSLGATLGAYRRTGGPSGNDGLSSSILRVRQSTRRRALLNYLYSLLEADARLASLAVGCDLGLSVIHAEQPYRDSFVLNLMEPARPR